MRLLLGIVLICPALFCQVSQPGNRAAPQSNPSVQQNPTTKNPDPSPLSNASGTSVISKPPSNSKQYTGKDEPQKIWQKAFAPETWSNWALVLLGGVGSFFGFRTLRALRQQVDANRVSAEAGLVQAKAAQVSAEAARLSAQAAIDIERPWIVVSGIDAPTLQAQDANVVPLGFAFDFQNRGRTPARIVGVWARFHTTQDVLGLPSPPDYREMGPEIEFDQRKVLTPGDPPYRLRREFEEGHLLDRQVQAIRQRQLFLICYGLMKYTDFAGWDHELQFSYGYYVPDGTEPVHIGEGWRAAGPAGYNRST